MYYFPTWRFEAERIGGHLHVVGTNRCQLSQMRDYDFVFHQAHIKWLHYLKGLLTQLMEQQALGSKQE